MSSGTKVSKHFFRINFKKHLQEVQLPTDCEHVVASFNIPDVSTQAASSGNRLLRVPEQRQPENMSFLSESFLANW